MLCIHFIMHPFFIHSIYRSWNRYIFSYLADRDKWDELYCWMLTTCEVTPLYFLSSSFSENDQKDLENSGWWDYIRQFFQLFNFFVIPGGVIKKLRYYIGFELLSQSDCINTYVSVEFTNYPCECAMVVCLYGYCLLVFVFRYIIIWPGSSGYVWADKTYDFTPPLPPPPPPPRIVKATIVADGFFLFKSFPDKIFLPATIYIKTILER